MHSAPSVAGRRVALAGIAVSAVLATLSIVVGLWTNSTSVVATGVEFAGDVLASTVVLVGMLIAGKPADSNHPYGHGRVETLAALPEEPSVDFAFLDADKGNYLAYYELLLPRLRPGGLLVVDNVLWGGRVIDADVDDADTEAIRAFNDHLAADDRVHTVMLPVADGLTLAHKVH